MPATVRRNAKRNQFRQRLRWFRLSPPLLPIFIFRIFPERIVVLSNEMTLDPGRKLHHRGRSRFFSRGKSPTETRGTPGEVFLTVRFRVYPEQTPKSKSTRSSAFDPRSGILGQLGRILKA